MLENAALIAKAVLLVVAIGFTGTLLQIAMMGGPY